MKKVFLTLVTIFALSVQGMLAEATKIGHRDRNSQPVLDLPRATLLAVITPSLQEKGFSNIRVAQMEISDNPRIQGYFTSLALKIVFDDGPTKNLSVSFLYPAAYDQVRNQYVLIDYTQLEIQDGGRPDKQHCTATNCIGCLNIRDGKGKLVGCTECAPVDPNANFSCSVGNLAGTGGGRVLEGLGGVLSALFKFL